MSEQWTPAVVCSVCLLTGGLPRPEAVVETAAEWAQHLIEGHSPAEIMAYGAFVADAKEGRLRRHQPRVPGT